MSTLLVIIASVTLATNLDSEQPSHPQSEIWVYTMRYSVNKFI